MISEPKNQANVKKSERPNVVRLRRRKRLVMAMIILCFLCAAIQMSGFVRRRATHLPLRRGGSYVTLCKNRLRDYHRTGNHLFMMAAMLDLATKTEREIAMPKSGWFLDRVFDFDESRRPPSSSSSSVRVHRYEDKSDVCPCEAIYTPHYDYDGRFNDTKFLSRYSTRNVSGDTPATLELCGLSQTHVHASVGVVTNLLKDLPRLLKRNAFDRAGAITGTIKRQAEFKLKSFALYSYDRPIYRQSRSFPLKSIGGYQVRRSSLTDDDGSGTFLVGIHVRMGDFLGKVSVAHGLTVATGSYYRNAIDLFLSLYKKIVFVVVSDDIDWVVKNFRNYVNPAKSDSASTPNETARGSPDDVKIIFFRDSSVQDFALLCRSDGLIMSTGTFGWWAGWFNSQAKVVYYAEYPRPNSTLAREMNKTNYYPSHWIPMT